MIYSTGWYFVFLKPDKWSSHFVVVLWKQILNSQRLFISIPLRPKGKFISLHLLEVIQKYLGTLNRLLRNDILCNRKALMLFCM